MRRRRKHSRDNAMLIEIAKVLRDEPRYSVAARRINEITRSFLPTVAQEKQLDLRRSAARMALIAATDIGAAFETVAKRFRARCVLGFDDVFSELAVFIDFAYACADSCKRKAGLRVLGQAQERLDGSGMKLRSEFVRHQSRLIEQCRRLLEGG